MSGDDDAEPATAESKRRAEQTKVMEADKPRRERMKTKAREDCLAQLGDRAKLTNRV